MAKNQLRLSSTGNQRGLHLKCMIVDDYSLESIKYILIFSVILKVDSNGQHFLVTPTPVLVVLGRFVMVLTVLLALAFYSRSWQ